MSRWRWIWASLLMMLFGISLNAQDVALNRGWSLIGSSVNIESEEFNQSVVGKVDIVWAYRNGKWTAASKKDDLANAIKKEGYAWLDNIKAGEGFWVYTSQSDRMLSFSGTPPTDNTLKIKKGWQILSPLTKDGIPMSDINKSSVGVVWTYNLGQWSAWSPDEKQNESLAALYPSIDKLWMGQGFWLYGKSDDEFEFGTPPAVPKVSVAGEVVGVETRTTSTVKEMGTASLIIDSNGDGVYDPGQGDKVLQSPIKNRSFAFADIPMPSGVKSMDVIIKVEIEGYAPVEKRLTLKEGSTPTLQVDMSASKIVKTTQKLDKRESARKGHFITFVVHKGRDGKRYMTTMRTSSADKLDVGDDADFAASYDETLFDSNVTAVTFTAQKFNSLDPKELQFFPGNFEAIVPRRALQRMGRHVTSNIGNEKVKLESVSFSYTKLEDQNGREITFDKFPVQRNAEDINFSDCRIVFRFWLNTAQRNLIEKKGDYDTNTTDFEVPIWGFRWGSKIWEYIGMGVYDQNNGNVKVCVTNPSIKNYHNIDYFADITAGEKPKSMCVNAEDQFGNPVSSVYIYGKEIGNGNDVINGRTNYKGYGTVTIPGEHSPNDYNISYSKWGWGIENIVIDPENIVSGGDEGCDYTLNLKVENPFSHTLIVHSYDINGSPRANKWIYLRSQEGLWYWRSKLTDQNGTAIFTVAANTKYKIEDKTAKGYVKIDNNLLQSDGYTETFDNGDMVEANLTQVERKPTGSIWLYGYYQIPEQTQSIVFTLYGYDENDDNINLNSLKIDGQTINIKPESEYHSAGYYYARFTYTIDPDKMELGDHNITAVLVDEKGNQSDPIVLKFTRIANRAPVIYSATIYNMENQYVNPRALRANKFYTIRVWGYDPDGDEYTFRYRFGANEQDENDSTFTFYEDGDYNITVYATDKPDNNVTPKTSQYTLPVHVGNNRPVIEYVSLPNRVVKGLPFSFTVNAHDIDSDSLDVTISDGLTEENLTQKYRYWWYKAGGAYKGDMNLTKTGDINLTIKAVDNEGGVKEVNRTVKVIPSKIYFVRGLPEVQTIDKKRRPKRYYSVYAQHYDGWYAARNIQYEWYLDDKKLDSTTNYIVVDYSDYNVSQTLNLQCKIRAVDEDGIWTAATSSLVTITSSNRAPIVNSIRNIKLKQGFGTYSTLIYAWDPDGDKLTYDAVASKDANFTVTVLGRQLTIGEIKGKYGEGDITVKVSDDENTTTKTFHVTIEKVDHPPVLALIPDVKFDENRTQIAVKLNATDPDGDTIKFEANWDDHNLIDVNVSGNSLLISRKADRFGRSLVTVFASDGQKRVKRVFGVYVPDISNPKVNMIDKVDTNEGFSKIDLNVTVDGKSGKALEGYAVLSVRKSFDAPFKVVLKNNHVYIKGIPYRYGKGWVTVKAYKLSNKKSGSATVKIDVKNVDNPPIFYTPQNGQTYKVYEDFGTTWISLNAVDPDRGNIKVTYALVKIEGDVIDANQSGIEDGMLKLVSIPNKHGKVEVTVKASSRNGKDDAQKSTFVKFNVEVIPVDDAPTMPDFKPLVLNEDFGTKVIELHATDVDGDPITYSYNVQENQSGIMVRIVGNKLELTSRADKYGTASIIVTATANGKSVSKTLNVTVRPINDAPYIAPIDKQTFYYKDHIVVPIKVTDVDSEMIDVNVRTCDQLLAQYDEDNDSIAIQLAPNAPTTGTCDVNVTASDGKKSYSRVFVVNWFNDTSALMTIKTPMEGLIVSLHDVNTLDSLKSKSTDENGTASMKIQKRNRATVMISAVPDSIANKAILIAYWSKKILGSSWNYYNDEQVSSGRVQDRATNELKMDAYMLPVKRIQAVLPDSYGKKASDFDDNNDSYLNATELERLSVDLYDSNPKDGKVSLNELYHFKGAHVVMVEDLPLGTYQLGLNDLLYSFVDYGDMDDVSDISDYLYAPDGHKELNVTITDLEDEDHVWLHWSGSSFGWGYYNVENNETTFSIDLTQLSDDGRYKVLFENGVDGNSKWHLETIERGQTHITISAKTFKNSRLMGVDQAGYYDVDADLNGMMNGLHFDVKDGHNYYADTNMSYYLSVEADTRPEDWKNGRGSDKGVDNKKWLLGDIPLELHVDDLGLLKVKTSIKSVLYRTPTVSAEGEDIDKIDLIGMEWRAETKLENDNSLYGLSFSIYDTNGTHKVESRKMMSHLVETVLEPAKKAFYAMKYVQTGMKPGWSSWDIDSFAIDLKAADTQQSFFEQLTKIEKDYLEMMWVGRWYEHDISSSSKKSLGIFEGLQDVAVDVNETAQMHLFAVSTLQDANLTYHWSVNGEEQEASGNRFSFTPSKVGDYVVKCEVSDGAMTAVSIAHIRVKDSVSGVVQVDEDGTVAQGAVVRLYSKWDNGRMYDQTVTTDETGTYHFENVPAGEYYLVIGADGYAPKTTVVNINTK